MTKNEWRVLLIGGNSGAGKTYLANQLVQKLCISSLMVDDLRIALQTITSSEHQPDLHLFLNYQLEHWNGSLLDSVEAVLGFAQTMTWQKMEPTVKLVTGIYETGKKLSLKAMDLLEERFEREKGLEKWFVQIRPHAPQNP